MAPRPLMALGRLDSRRGAAVVRLGMPARSRAATSGDRPGDASASSRSSWAGGLDLKGTLKFSVALILGNGA
eukprot:CAMPEP_0117540858 /NCGR_PEP_ID=MMETSP0784-20121206/43716_1 /TAXON_ID=39447 /ORGANISM="" /LENGTH=71 /DNA_ID=CAMNT_0005337527 /DNA_START=12 /DNA_END=224 /DNA_ORIENTATION=-